MSNLQFEPLHFQAPSEKSNHERADPSGIKIVIVGAGFAGVCAAIECDRKGHSVVLLEKVKELKPLGDLISFGSNAARVFHKWGNVFETLDPLTYKSPGIDYFNWEGKFVTRQNWDNEKNWGPGSISGHRGEIHMIVMQHAIERGIDVRFGQDVTEYFETDSEAGVISNGETIVGDVVLAAEGVKSPGRKAVLGYEDQPKPSGYAVYRAWYPSSRLEHNDLVRHLVVNGDTHTGWVR
jgi:2-polyprenyl-6-methoxyphenol hydroxylase-like FAD-dependent oxidoreductase